MHVSIKINIYSWIVCTIFIIYQCAGPLNTLKYKERNNFLICLYLQNSHKLVKFVQIFDLFTKKITFA